MAKRLRTTSAVLWTLVILVLCWTPQSFLPEEGVGPRFILGILGLDKIVHAGIFTVFAVLWLRALPGGWARYWWVALAGTALAGLTEAVQNLPIIRRDGEFQDVVADVVGLVIGLPAYLWLETLLGRWRAARPVEAIPGPDEPPLQNACLGEKSDDEVEARAT